MVTGLRLHRAIHGIAIAASLLVAFTFWKYPPPISLTWLTAFATLLGLSILSMMLNLRFTEGGSTSSMDFVPELGAILLVGPAGAAALTILSEAFSNIVLYRDKPFTKKLFNAAQLTLAVTISGLIYASFGGVSTLVTSEFHFQPAFPPFFVAVIAYFTINTGTVSYVVARAENRPYGETWRSMTGGLIFFDLAMSPLAFLVAYFYLRGGPLGVLLAIIPLIGLRYSYGVNYELQQLNGDILRLMIKTIEAQDPYTSGHSIRVAESASRIARELNLSARKVQTIETAALLHDIGKIDIAYGEILRQKGPLTPEQRQLIREHPDKGVNILKSIRSLSPAVLRCVRHHHERMDGDGYPDQLTGDQIPLGARIIMVSDTIDAMRTARPYRKALPISVVQAELLKHSGTQFDSRIVKVVVDSHLLEEMDTPKATPEGAGTIRAG